MRTKNLGNVAGVVKGLTPPLESDGSEKRYVLWAKEIPTNPVSYQLMYYDLTKSGWYPIIGVSEADFNLIKHYIFNTLNLSEIHNILDERGVSNLIELFDNKSDVNHTHPGLEDYINDLQSGLDSQVVINENQDERIENLEGINYTWSPTNRTLTLYDNNGNQLSQVSLVSLDNEGTDLRYNASTLSLELYNADNELLDSIPVSSFIGSVGTQLQLNSNQLQLKDSQGNILSTVSFTVSNINGLQTALDTKLDKGTYTGTAQDLKNSIDSKLNKPTTTSNTTSYPYVVGEDGNGNSARLPAGDLGKNFFNSDLSNTTARTHTMNAGVTINTLGNPHTLSGLPNKNTDITNFRKVRVQNASGLDSVVDSKNLLTDGMTSMTDAEKDAWRLAQRKTNETYSTGQPRVDLISPPLIETAKNYIQYVSIIGSNLFINNSISSNSIVTLQRFKDVNNIVLITPDPEINITNKVTVIQSLPNIFYIAENFSNYSDGYYRIKITNNGLTNIINDSINLLIKYNFVSESFNNFSIDSNTTNPNISYNINGNNSIEIVSSNASQFGAVKLNKLLDINPNVGLYLKGVFSIRGVSNGAMSQLVKVGFGDNQPINNNPLLKTFFQVDGVSNKIGINGASYISLPDGIIGNYEFNWIIKNGTATISFPNVPSLKVTVPINNITELYLYISLSSLSIPSSSQQYISFSITDIKTI